MPTILDATVVASAYDTSGNGGRKLVRLSDGSLVNIVANNSLNPAEMYLYRSVNNGTTWVRLCYFKTGGSSTFKPSIVNKGTTVYVLCSDLTAVYSYKIDALTQTNVDISSTKVTVDSSQSSLNRDDSLAINDTGTELHATWSSKNATYANSFNIRYAKGTINADGSVAWGAVEQWTKFNTSGWDAKNPSIIVYNNEAIIFADVYDTTKYYITAMKKTGLPSTSAYYTYTYKDIHSIASYAQQSPSAIFVPQSINGLANGRIWVAWHGGDATSSNVRARVSYSDDGGITWSAMVVLANTTNINWFPSITANKNNEIYVVWWENLGASDKRIKKIKNVGNVWGAVTEIAGIKEYPSTLFDLSVNFTEPLFIYKDTAKVGFYGTWTVTTINVTQGSIGQKTSPSNLLTYAITTDGTMSTITEKVNGVTIGTRTTPASGQSFIAGLTQAQWDAVKFGKYANATGGANTLTITMGSEVFTYTFDKRLATDADVLSAVKATQDAQTTYLPAVKSKLASAITSKGGSATGADSWDALENGIKGIPLGKKFASGNITPSTTLASIRGLSFAPSVFIFKRTGTNDRIFMEKVLQTDVAFNRTAVALGGNTTTNLFVNTINWYSDGIEISSVLITSTNYQWIAFE